MPPESSVSRAPLDLSFGRPGRFYAAMQLRHRRRCCERSLKKSDITKKLKTRQSCVPVPRVDRQAHAPGAKSQTGRQLPPQSRHQLRRPRPAVAGSRARSSGEQAGGRRRAQQRDAFLKSSQAANAAMATAKSQLHDCRPPSGRRHSGQIIGCVKVRKLLNGIDLLYGRCKPPPLGRERHLLPRR
jgi:hypothetical protein